MYPELLTRRDLSLFLPPIGGMTVYIFGNPAFLSDPSKETTVRVHDECNGSDVFGSDICTCRPYLIYGIEEAARCAQRGGVGVIVYFRKEGRALGEVTKCESATRPHPHAPSLSRRGLLTSCLVYLFEQTWCTTLESEEETLPIDTSSRPSSSRESRTCGSKRSCRTCSTGSESQRSTT